MSDRIKVAFLRPFRAYRRGDVIEMDRGPAKSWVIAGIVAPVEHEQRLIEEATVARQVETADAPRRRRRK
jgi:hypothetical protein